MHRQAGGRLSRGVIALLVTATFAAACGDSADDAGDTGGGTADTGTAGGETADTGGGTANTDGEEPADTGTGGGSDTATSDAEVRRGGQLRVLTGSEPRLIDPTVTGAGVAGDGIYGYAVFGSLVDITPGQQGFEPVLAESLTSDDNVVWTLKLRDGVTFTDGTPLDAEAVKFNWDRYLAEAANPSPSARAIESIEVVDPLTLQVTLATTYGVFPEQLQGLNYIGSPTAIGELGEQFGSQPVGAGPFVFEEWVRGSFARFSRNPDWWEDGKPYLDEIVIQASQDGATNLNTLLADGTDVTELTSWGDVAPAQGAGFVEVDPFELITNQAGLVFNAGKPPFDDKRARCGFIQAIDFELINEQLTLGLAPVPMTFWNEAHELYDPERQFLPYDPAAAQEAFDALAADGRPLSFILRVQPQYVPMAEALSTQLSAYDNVSMSTEVAPSSELAPIIFSGEHDLVTWGMDQTGMDFSLRTVDGAPNPQFGFSTPDLDSQLDAISSGVDETKRLEALRAIEDMLIDECLFRVNPKLNGPVYASPKVQGWSLNIISPRWEELWLSE